MGFVMSIKTMLYFLYQLLGGHFKKAPIYFRHPSATALVFGFEHPSKAKPLTFCKKLMPLC
jgi:hypothetical protein